MLLVSHASTQRPAGAPAQRRPSASAGVVGLLGVVLALSLAATASASWIDGNWTHRRPVDVEWLADRPTGEELAWADIYTAGRHKPDGSDVRVATDDGRIIPARVLHVGPGDRFEVLFALQKNVRRYWVYWGNPAPPAPPAGTTDLKLRWGLHLEMRKAAVADARDFRSMEAAWEKSTQVIGQTMVARPFLGVNPFGDQAGWIMKLTGAFTAPVEGDYTFAATARQRGALYIDGKPLVFVAAPVSDARFTATVKLKKGRYDFAFYNISPPGDLRISVVCKSPPAKGLEQMHPHLFGAPFKTVVGPMEEKGKSLVSDFRVDYLGECFYAGHYSHRYRFTAWPPKTAATAVKYEWDFGDGQKAAGGVVEHVFLTDGEHPISLQTRAGTGTDSQVHRVRVGRNYESLDKPPTDSVGDHSKLVGAYDIKALPAKALPWAVYLHLRAGQWDQALAVATRLASSKDDTDPPLVFEALAEATRELIAHDRAAAAIKLWDLVPTDAKVYPRAAQYHAELLLWRTGEFAKAVKILQPLAADKRDHALQRTYAMALLLDGKAAQATTLLQSLPMQGSEERKAALSGAMARTVEYYITEKDWETGEETWNKWTAQFPADFLDGYSVLLKVKLMELKGAGEAAAAVAEAFVTACPNSSYAPQLLHRASTLLSKTNPAKSSALGEKLKKNYPEDPLSQD